MKESKHHVKVPTRIIRSQSLLFESLTQEKALAVSFQCLYGFVWGGERVEKRMGDQCAWTAWAGKRSKGLKLESAERGMIRLA